MSDILTSMTGNLFAKYRHSPYILGLFEVIAGALQDTSDVLDFFEGQLSIDTGEGVILENLGGWIGVNRPPAQEEDGLVLIRDGDILGDPENHHGLAPDDLSTGGYLYRDDGLPSKADPNSFVDNPTYRLYIRAKAAAFRRRATRDTLYNYALQFGVRPKIIEGVRSIQIQPSDYDDLTMYLRYHLIHRGFRPAGIEVSIYKQSEQSAEV